MINLPNILDGEDKSSLLCNRIRKNYRHIRKWAKRTDTNCFRIYDRDIGKYPLAIDFYDGKFCAQYFSKWKGLEDVPDDIRSETNHALQTIFGASDDAIYWRTRKRRAKVEQYEKAAAAEEFFTVYEYGIKFRINLKDYLDTGLFLDHRETRKMVASFCKDKRVLNLFAYTCSFSVHAALAGAAFTKSVDMSNTYTAWGKENLLLNSLSLKKHQVVRADCLKFLTEELQTGGKYGVIIIDPPTISRSKKMDQMFDIQIDYIPIINKSLLLLQEDGVIFFSTNSRRFLFEEKHFAGCTIQEISDKTIPLDFHDPKIHRCWKLTKNSC